MSQTTGKIILQWDFNWKR